MLDDIELIAGISWRITVSPRSKVFLEVRQQVIHLLI
jgi:hypothetical protein